MKKTTTVSIKISPKDRDRIYMIAEKMGETSSEYMFRHVMKAVRKDERLFKKEKEGNA